MIISHKYKFIFLKTKKVSGTSLEVALAKHLGQNDVITHVSELTLNGRIRRFENETEEDLRKEIGALSPQNYKGSVIEEFFRGARQLQHYCRNKILNEMLNLFRTGNAKIITHQKRGYRFEQHMPIQEVKDRIDSEIFKSYTKISIVRNPYDQIISDYWDQVGRPERQKFDNFDEFLQTRGSVFFKKNWIKLGTGDQVLVDKVIRYEYLHDDIRSFCKSVGLPGDEVVSDMKKLRIHGGA